MQEPLHLHGTAHQISCRLLKQLETNCYEIPPRERWWKQEVARDLQAEVHLFFCQSLGNSTFHLWNGAEVAAGAHRWLHTLTFPLCTLWDNWVLLCLFEPQKSCMGIFNSSISSSPSLCSPAPPQSSPLETECHFHDKWILSAAVKDTSLELGWAAHSPGTQVWGSNEPRGHLTVLFTFPGVNSFILYLIL